MVLLVVLVFVVIIAIEVPGLVKEKMWRELTAFMILLFFGLVISIPQATGLRIPSPNEPIELFFKPLAEWLTPK